MEIPQFANKAALIDFLVENKETIITQKKMALKTSDAISYAPSRLIDRNGEEIKASSSDQVDLIDADRLKLELVINTTNLMDSHRDVHFRGIWSKSLKEQRNLMLLQEHQMKFDSIISDQVKASAKIIGWDDLGYEYEGKTQALIFKTEISKDRNPFMFEQYAKGYVRNHSVGMRYVKIDLATNDERYPEEVSVWNKYFDKIVNKEMAEEIGYFWAVTEAKIVEGSAVPMGSNHATPTLTIEAKQDIDQPSSDTDQNEPPSGTQDQARSKRSSLYFY